MYHEQLDEHCINVRITVFKVNLFHFLSPKKATSKRTTQRQVVGQSPISLPNGRGHVDLPCREALNELLIWMFLAEDQPLSHEPEEATCRTACRTVTSVPVQQLTDGNPPNRRETETSMRLIWRCWRLKKTN